MHTDYLNPAIRQLRDQQVRFAPREKKMEQATQAERLLGELDPTRTYPYEYICYRITNFRPESYPDLKLSGQEASHDLRLFVEDVSDSASVPADAAGEQVLTVETLAKHFNVSTKTISRWRRHGLISRRFVLDGRKRVGFLQSSVDRFVEHNQERVHRGARFSQLTDEERAAIIERARRLARAGGRPSEVTKRLARKTGRSAETIRYTLRGIRSGPSRRRRVSREPRAAANGCQTQDLSAIPARRVGRDAGPAVLPHPDQHLPDHCRDAGSADHGTALGLHPQRSLRPRALAEARRAAPGSRYPSRNCRRRRRGCPAACRPTWPASTRCRC